MCSVAIRCSAPCVCLSRIYHTLTHGCRPPRAKNWRVALASEAKGRGFDSRRAHSGKGRFSYGEAAFFLFAVGWFSRFRLLPSITLLSQRTRREGRASAAGRRASGFTRA